MMKTPTRNLLIACIAIGPLASLQAADILQNGNAGLDQTWNTISLWGDGVTALDPGDNYITQIFATPTAAFTTNGITWSYGGTMRDDAAGSTFGGGTLTLAADTRLLGKSTAAANVNSANIILDGGYIFSGSNGGTTGGILDGTISFASLNDWGAVSLNSPNGVTMFTYTVSSSLIGDASDTLQLTMVNEAGALGLGTLLFDGDLSAFSGTLYVGNATSGSAPGSFYSIRSSSISTSLIIDTATFSNAGGGALYDLATDETFGSVIVGGITLGAGTYDEASLDGIAGGDFFTGTGSITVVPEPSSSALGMLGLLVFAAVLRWKKKA